MVFFLAPEKFWHYYGMQFERAFNHSQGDVSNKALSSWT